MNEAIGTAPLMRSRRGAGGLIVRLLAAPVTAVIVLVGIWVSGGVITNDFTLAMWLTVAWMGLAGLGALGVAWRSRGFRWPVLVGYVVTAGAVGLVLGSSMFFDDVVNEQVARAGTAGNTALAAGNFEPVRHEASGQAHAIELADGQRVLTLTSFAVDNGPDLRVYLVAGPAASEGEVDDVIDLGGMKGNKGNQQYTIPSGVDLERHSTVVIWCRAFSALFARAPLTPAT
jgi:electron transfer DM13